MHMISSTVEFMCATPILEGLCRPVVINIGNKDVDRGCGHVTGFIFLPLVAKQLTLFIE